MALLDVAGIAGEQWGLVTTAQAASVGASAQSMARWARDGVLVRVTHGVYKVAGSPYDSSDDLRAAWLMLDPKRTATERLAAEPIDAVVSHRSAARLHGLGDLDADLYEFTVEGRRQTRRRDVRIHSRKTQISRESWTLVAGTPVTTALTTIVDLAADHTDGGHLGGVVRDAVATAVVDIDNLSEALRPYAHRYGAPLGDGEAVLRRFLAEAGLPKTTELAADLVGGAGLSASAISRLTASDPDLLRLLDTLSSPNTRRNLAEINQALEAIRKATE